MKTLTRKAPGKMPKTFAELSELLPLRPIEDKIDLKNAIEIMDRLAVLNRRTKDQNDYLETLILLTEKYEQDEIADALDRSKSAGADALRYLMKLHDMSQAEVAKLLGVGASAASMIVSGDRPITADHARNLAKRFRVGVEVFL